MEIAEAASVVSVVRFLVVMTVVMVMPLCVSAFRHGKLHGRFQGVPGIVPG
jgi:hypothetical protein